MTTTNSRQRLVVFKTVVHHYDGRVADKVEARDLESRKGATRGTSKVMVELIPEQFKQPTTQAHSELRKYIYDMSLTWQDGGWRAVPANKFAEFEAGFVKLRQTFVDAAQKLQDAVPEIDAINKGGRLGKDWSERFKLPADLASRYGADDFEFGTDDCESKLDAIEDGLAARITESRQKQLDKQLQECATELSERVLKVAQEAAARLGAADLKGAKLSGLLDAIRQTAVSVRSLNFTGDTHLEQMADDLAKSIDAMDDQALKANGKKRQEVVSKARSIADLLLKKSGKAPTAGDPVKVPVQVKPATPVLPQGILARPASPAPVVPLAGLALAARLLGKR